MSPARLVHSTVPRGAVGSSAGETSRTVMRALEGAPASLACIRRSLFELLLKPCDPRFHLGAVRGSHGVKEIIRPVAFLVVNNI